MFQLLSFLQTWVAARRSDERGATMVEYGLMVALVAVIVAIAASVLGEGVSTLFNTTEGSL